MRAFWCATSDAAYVGNACILHMVYDEFIMQCPISRFGILEVGILEGSKHSLEKDKKIFM